MKNPKPRRVAEDYLDLVEAITLTLENGEKVTLKIRDEVRIPTDPARMRDAAIKAPAKLAFWAYQCERQLARVRKAELELARVEGREYQVYRAHYNEEGLMVTEPLLRASVDQSPKVRAARLALNSRRREYGALRAVRDAVEHRSWTLRTLLQHPES